MNPKHRFNLECALAEQLIQREDTWKDFGIRFFDSEKMQDELCLRHYDHVADRAFELAKNLSDKELKEALE